jgi:hypothetical protein
MDVISLSSNREKKKEKIIFIPRERIISASLDEELKGWKKFFTSRMPRLVLHFRDTNNLEKQLLFEVEIQPEDLAEKLASLPLK